jgi:hypothetical protein
VALGAGGVRRGEGGVVLEFWDFPVVPLGVVVFMFSGRRDVQSCTLLFLGVPSAHGTEPGTV